MIRWLALPLWITAVLVLGTTLARASVDGSVPSPGGCDFPAVGTFGAAMGEYDYACQFPVEENGSRHTTLFGGGMWQVTAAFGVSFMIFNASIAATVPTGVLRGITYWACPDFSFSDPPNPPGAWKNYLKPKPCKTIGPRPELLRDMPEPPPGAPAPPPPPEPIVSLPSPAPEPVIPPGQPTAPWQPGLSPAITNPQNPNPDAIPGEPRP